MEVRKEQPAKALSAINRVFSLIVYTPDIDVFATIKQLSIYNTSFFQFDSSLYIAVPLKAPAPMLVTLLGMVMEVREEQHQKASLPMLVTLLGMVTEVREEQFWKA